LTAEGVAGPGAVEPFSSRFPHVACALCGADESDPLVAIDVDFDYLGVIADHLARGDFRFVRCRRCGLAYLNPRPTPEQVRLYYPEEYSCFSELPPRSRLIGLLYRVLVRLKSRTLLPRLPEKGVLLDFGCGNGHWLVSLRPYARPGQRFVGMDMTPHAIARLEAQGIEAHVGGAEELPEVFEPDSVDLVLLSHVIEHVPDPVDTLRRLAHVMKPGGEIHGVTPNWRAWDARVFGRHWAGWHVPRHFALFDRETFARCAEKAGLELVEWRSSLEAASHWALSAQTVLGRRIGWHPRPGRLRMRIYPLFVALGMAVTVPQMLVSQTSVGSFLLRKPAPA